MSNLATQTDNSHFEIAIHSDEQFAIITLSGSVTLELINRIFLSFISHPSFKTNLNAIYDYSAAIIETSIQDVERHAEFVKQHLVYRGTSYKVAMVVNEPLNAALLNVYCLNLSKTDIECDTFSSTKMALRWLNG